MRKFTFWILIFASQSLCALTTLTVTVSSDNNPGGLGDVGDLRYCLNAMNQSLNTIADDIAINFATTMTVQLNGDLPTINNSSNPVNITIGNSGSMRTVTIDGNSGAYRGFFIPMGNVTIQNMTLQNLTAKGGNGGNGISGGGGGTGSGGAIYAPQTFLNGSNPSVTLMNVEINNCSAVGGNGGSYMGLSSVGNEGGGGGGGFGGNGGSITTTGSTGGGGGGGFGGDGGDVTLSTNDLLGGGGGGGGGIGSRATLGLLSNLGNGGSDQNVGFDGNGYGLSITAGSGGGGNSGGTRAGGGGGGAAIGPSLAGGGGGGSAGQNGVQPQGSIPPKDAPIPSGGNGGDGAGGGGAGVVTTLFSNGIGGQAGNGGHGGGGGGGAGTGAYDTGYTVQGGAGGLGGGGGGGGANQSGSTPSEGGNSLGGGGGGGGGPSNGSNASGGADVGNLGGGSGGAGSNSFGVGFGGGGGGGGSGLGAAIFVDSNLNFTLQAFPAVPTSFNTSNNTTQAGTHGTGAPGASDGTDGSAFGNSIFLRTGSSLTLRANDAADLLTLGDQVAFMDDTGFGAGGTSVFVKGDGTVVYNGTTDYQGTVTINNANLKVNGQIDDASIFVCRNSGFSSQRGKLSGIGTLTGSVFANSGTISPDAGGTLTLGSLTLNPADLGNGALGSLVHIDVNSGGTSVVAVTGAASLAGILEINLDSNVTPGLYTVLTSSGITGTFDNVTFAGATPNYTLSYLPSGTPTYVQLNFQGYPHPFSNLVVNTSGMPQTATLGLSYSGTYSCANTATTTATADAPSATCTMTDLPAGLSVSGCTISPLAMLWFGPHAIPLGDAVTCTVSGVPTTSGNFMAIAQSTSSNNSNTTTNHTTVSITIPPVTIPATLNGAPLLSPAVVCCGRPVILGDLPIAGSGPTVYSVTGHTGDATCTIGQLGMQTYLKMTASHGGSCTIVGTKNGIASAPLTVVAP